MLEEWNVTVPALTGDEERRAWVYVPDSAWADRERRYPVLYMFDGQNLFRDEDATYGKSWGLLDYLTEHNVPLIVAAVECNKHAEDEPCGGRLSEYSPFDISFGDWGDIKGRGELTMDFLINDFKRRIDEQWPTKPDRKHSFIAGSSMGGLMTIYALMAYNDTFSRGAALSPSLDFDPERVKAMIREARTDHALHGYGAAGAEEKDGEKSLRRSHRAAYRKGRALREQDRSQGLSLGGLLGAADPLFHEYFIL